MSESKHTPGPWFVDEDQRPDIVCVKGGLRAAIDAALAATKGEK